MKRLVLAGAAVCTLILGFGAMAQQAPVVCVNGKIDQVGDRYFEVEVLEDGIQINPYEGSITVDATDVALSGKVY